MCTVLPRRRRHAHTAGRRREMQRCTKTPNTLGVHEGGSADKSSHNKPPMNCGFFEKRSSALQFHFGPTRNPISGGRSAHQKHTRLSARVNRSAYPRPSLHKVSLPRRTMISTRTLETAHLPLIPNSLRPKQQKRRPKAALLRVKTD